jgi:preprotein translocase subunit SecG
MTTVVIVVHLMVVLAMIGVVLLQRSEGGALGIGGGQGAFLSGRSAGNILTRSTAILAVAFFATSLGLALISKYQSRPADILEKIPGQSTPATTTQAPVPAAPTGAPATAEDLLKQLGGEAKPAGGPQTPPSTNGATTPTAPAAPAPATTPAPASTPAPAAQDSAPAAPQAPSAQETAPAASGSASPQPPPAAPAPAPSGQ